MSRSEVLNEINVDGQTVTAATTDATIDQGKEVTLTIIAKIKDGITDEELIEKKFVVRLNEDDVVFITDGRPQTSTESDAGPIVHMTFVFFTLSSPYNKMIVPFQIIIN